MLTGKKIFITGSSRGIGAGIARLAVKYGANVILHGQKESEHLKKLSEELSSPYITFDVADREVAKRYPELERLDILINNAGINPSKTFQQLTDDDWQRIFEVNLFGAVYVSRAVLKGMLERKQGSIVNITSIKGYPHVSGKPGYASSKAALIELTARMAEEYAPYGIRVNAVAPGFVGTKLTATTLQKERSLGKVGLQSQIDRIPFKRMGTVSEIGEAVLFLASDKANYITGQCLNVDGGLSIV